MMKIDAINNHESTTGASPLDERLHEQAPHPGYREDLFGDDETAEQRADVERHDRDERDQRVAQRRA